MPIVERGGQPLEVNGQPTENPDCCCDDCIRCRRCCRSKSSVATVDPLPVIGSGGSAFQDAVQAALAAMSGVLTYHPESGRWREYGAPFTAEGTTYRLVITADCEEESEQIYAFYESLLGGVWTFGAVAAFIGDAGVIGGTYAGNCCVETWTRWRDLNGGSPTDHDEEITLTWTENTCCQDGEGNCISGTIDCETGDCAEPPAIMARQLPPQDIPDDFDPEAERNRMKQGGCCGKASKGTA